MAKASKFTPGFWLALREHWENDPRDGYKWLVDENRLDISTPGVRKKALQEGWTKKVSALEVQPAEKLTQKTARKTKPSKGSSGGDGFSVDTGETKVRKTRGKETLVTARENMEANPDRFGTLVGLTDKEEIFVREYMVDWNAKQAAIRSGYSPRSAGQAGYAMLNKPHVKQAVHDLASARARRMGIDADDLMRLWAAIVSLDANELSQLRRVCCPYCYSEDGKPLLSPSGLEQAKRKHDAERAKRLRANAEDDIGEYPEYTGPWLDKRLPPSEECLECRGEGVEEVFFADTRYLSPAALQVYSGVRVGERGIEVLTLSREKAMEWLARALGLFREREPDGSGAVSVTGEELCKLFDDRMRAARERQATVDAERLSWEQG